MNPLPDSPHIAVVGAGAVGAWYACTLQAAGARVSVLARSDYPVVKDAGYCLVDHNGERWVRPFQVANDPDEIGPVDLVIVTVKTTANSELAGLIGPLVGARTIILTLQNGLGNVEALGRHFDPQSILGGLCFVCINRTAPGRIENYLPGKIILGEPRGGISERLLALVNLFASAGINAGPANSLDEALWKKLCWNIPFNGLSIAAGGITTDKILSNPSLTRMARELMNEIQAAATLKLIRISNQFLDTQFSSTARMGAYRPSSLIDYLNNRPVEIESIWGIPLRIMQSLNSPHTHLQSLYWFIRHAVESRPPQSPQP